MPSMIMKKMGSTKAASAISEPRVSVAIFLSLLTSISLLARARTRAPTLASCAAPDLAAGVQNYRDGYGYAKRHLYQIWIIQGQVGSGQVHTQESGEHASQVAGGLAHAFFPDDHDSGHQAVHQNSKYQHGEQILRTEEGSQGAYKFPVSGAEAAEQDEGQKQGQAKAGAQQRIFGARPAAQIRIGRNPEHETGNGQPVGDAA